MKYNLKTNTKTQNKMIWKRCKVEIWLDAEVGKQDFGALSTPVTPPPYSQKGQ